MNVDIINNCNNENNPPAPLSDIKSVWYYLISLMKFVTDTDEKNKKAYCGVSNFYFDEFEKNKSDWDNINKELKDLGQNFSQDNINKVKELQNQQNQCSFVAKDLQNKMEMVWKVSESSITNDEYYTMQQGYKIINDMLKNNPSLVRR